MVFMTRRVNNPYQNRICGWGTHTGGREGFHSQNHSRSGRTAAVFSAFLLLSLHTSSITLPLAPVSFRNLETNSIQTKLSVFLLHLPIPFLYSFHLGAVNRHKPMPLNFPSIPQQVIYPSQPSIQLVAGPSLLLFSVCVILPHIEGMRAEIRVGALLGQIL